MIMNYVLVVTAWVGLCACRTAQSSHVTSPAHRLSGVVLTSEGRPLALANGVVVITNPSTTEEIGFTVTDSVGRFALNSPVVQVALTAATRRGWAFLPRVDIGSRDVQVRLSRDCVVLRGKIALDDDPPAPKLELVRIGRFSKMVGDLYGVIVDPSYQFEACLPPAEYYVTIPPEFVDRTILTMVPAPDPLVIRAVSQRGAATPLPAALGIRSRTRTEFVTELESSIRLLGLGETNHGTHEFTRERTQLAIALARAHQFTLLLIEAGYSETLALDDYIKGAPVSISDVLKAIGYWIWNTTALRDSLEELREYNRTASPDRRITLRGIDIQNTAGAIDHLQSSGIQFSDEDRKLLTRLRERKGEQWTELSHAERSSIRKSLEQIAAERDARGLDSARNRYALSALALLLRFELLEQEGFWNRGRARDAGMARLTQELLGLEPLVRATLWAHLSHVAREFVVGAPTLGQHLGATLGGDYRVYALLTFGGAARARHANKELGVVSHTLPRPPPYSLESALLRGAPDSATDVTYWAFEHAGPAGRRWLQGLHWVQFFGAIYPADNSPFRVLDLSTFDGAILFRSVTPIVPMVSDKGTTASPNP